MKNAEYPSVSNQRYIVTHKPMSTAGDFTYIRLSRTRQAMAVLSPSAFMMYMYFSLNADKYEYWLWKTSFLENTGLSKNTYYSAFKELQTLGYLVPRAHSKHVFDFYDSPHLQQTEPKEGTPYTKKWDDTYQEEVQIINNKTENKEEHAHTPEAQGSSQEDSLFYDF